MPALCQCYVKAMSTFVNATSVPCPCHGKAQCYRQHGAIFTVLGMANAFPTSRSELQKRLRRPPVSSSQCGGPSRRRGRCHYWRNRRAMADFEVSGVHAAASCAQ
eukprot:896926-Lingulodinium_polyedra.AAC.1